MARDGGVCFHEILLRGKSSEGHMFWIQPIGVDDFKVSTTNNRIVAQIIPIDSPTSALKFSEI